MKHRKKSARPMPSQKRKKIVRDREKGFKFSKDELYPCNVTIPDQAISMRDVLERFSRGLPVNSIADQGYSYVDGADSHDAPDFDAMRRLDPMDRKDLARSARVNRKKKDEADKPVDKPAPHPKGGQEPADEPAA